MSAPAGSQGTPSPGAQETTKEIVRIIESDHKATIELIARLTTLRAGLRGVVFTLASTVLGLALVQLSWPLAVFGVPVVIAGYFAEARLEFLVRLAHDRSVRLERKIQAYLATLVETGVVGPDAQENFKREVETYQFGSSRSLRGPSIRKAIRKSFRDAMTFVYLALVIALILSATAIGLTGGNRQDGAVTCLRTAGGVVQIEELPVVESGSVTLVACPEDAPTTPPSIPR